MITIIDPIENYFTAVTKAAFPSYHSVVQLKLFKCLLRPCLYGLGCYSALDQTYCRGLLTSFAVGLEPYFAIP